MNSAILVSYVAKKGTWKGSVDKLNQFWRYVSVNPNVQNIPGFSIWWRNWHKLDPIAASDESARRYYSTKEFLFTGVKNVFLPSIPRPDTRFFDPQNTWYIYNNQPLKDSLESHANFPIATDFNPNLLQPRLLLVSIDVLEGAAVTFDSYPKDKDGVIRRSEYGNYIKKREGTEDRKKQQHYEYAINYDKGITSDYAMASGSVQINYDYTTLDANKLTVDSQGNEMAERVKRYFWDGGISSNTPLRELIQAHKDYWLDVKGDEKVYEYAPVPDLDVYIIDVWSTKEKDISLDHDGVID